MRLWHYKLLPYLPDLQFKGQRREMVTILHNIFELGFPNHLLVNRVIKYSNIDYFKYYLLYNKEHIKRYGKPLSEYIDREFKEYALTDDLIKPSVNIFDGWHNLEYLRICMANLYEKHLGIGGSRVNDTEWNLLKQGYFNITGNEYFV